MVKKKATPYFQSPP